MSQRTTFVVLTLSSPRATHQSVFKYLTLQYVMSSRLTSLSTSNTSDLLSLTDTKITAGFEGIKYSSTAAPSDQHTGSWQRCQGWSAAGVVSSAHHTLQQGNTPPLPALHPPSSYQFLTLGSFHSFCCVQSRLSSLVYYRINNNKKKRKKRVINLRDV